MKTLTIILAVLSLVFAAAVVWLTMGLADASEAIPQESDGTLWSLSEGPYEYIGDASLDAFNTIYMPGQFYAVGQIQYKGMAVLCMMGTPQLPVDSSGRECWCIPWWYNADTLEWEMGEPYLWGTQAQYAAWREAEELAPVLP